MDVEPRSRPADRGELGTGQQQEDARRDVPSRRERRYVEAGERATETTTSRPRRGRRSALAYVVVNSRGEDMGFQDVCHGTLRMSAHPCTAALQPFIQIKASAIYDLQRNRSNLESLFCYDKSVPEENIGKPSGLNLEKKNVGDNPPCSSCEAKGAVLCATCAGSGLYVDSILESQGIIVKVRCLGCGGTGNIMCSKCGGRGHT
ncbi:unnamed protein product [Miscanthus lutarioriparius]|uniref:Uncharacterized protein n=1 Tax=Miscanthus lutarioriparius TaxID=422564 RepID=A0A811MXQ9_9POAL|nr:unnamed protein product [Miscanthus lutarioriparius]